MCDAAGTAEQMLARPHPTAEYVNPTDTFDQETVAAVSQNHDGDYITTGCKYITYERSCYHNLLTCSVQHLISVLENNVKSHD